MGGGPSFDEYDEEEVLRALREKRLADSMASEPSARFDGAANLATREYLDAKAPQGPDYAKYMDWQPTPDHPDKEAELRALLPGFQASDPENAADYRSRLDAILATKPGASSPVSEFASGGARPPGVMGNLVDFVSQGARIAAPIGKHFAPVPAKVAPPPAATPGAEPELAPLVQPQKQAAPAPAPKAVRVSKAPKSPGITTQEAIAALNEGLADAPWKEKAPPPVATPPPAVVERASGGDPRLASALSRMMAGGGGLDMALKSSNQNRLIASLARAGGMAIGRGKSEAYDALENNADRPLQELQMRQGEQARQADADPNSPASQTLRMALSRMVPDLEKQPGWATTSAAQLKQLFPFAKEIAEAEARKSDRKSAAADRNASREDQQSFTAGQNALQRAQSAENARIMASIKQDAKMDERQVGGLEMTGKPSADDAKQMKEAVQAANLILNDLGRMEDVYSGKPDASGKRSGGKGAEFGWGEDQRVSTGSQTNVLLKLKELENLGVLQKVDVDTLSQIIPDPNSMRGVFDEGGTKAAFANFNKQLRETVSARAAARGYRVTDPRLRGGPAAPKAPSGPVSADDLENLWSGS
jgi:hypothetical protein